MFWFLHEWEAQERVQSADLTSSQRNCEGVTQFSFEAGSGAGTLKLYALLIKLNFFLDGLASD